MLLLRQLFTSLPRHARAEGLTHVGVLDARGDERGVRIARQSSAVRIARQSSAVRIARQSSAVRISGCRGVARRGGLDRVGGRRARLHAARPARCRRARLHAVRPPRCRRHARLDPVDTPGSVRPPGSRTRRRGRAVVGRLGGRGCRYR
jgi:hypothetical protein